MVFSEVSSFYISLLSGCSINYYPNNTLSKFTTKLPYDLNLTKDQTWEVGIKRLAFNSIKNASFKPNDIINIDDENLIVFENKDTDFGIDIIRGLHAVPNCLEEVSNDTFFNLYTDSNLVLKIPTYRYKNFIKFLGNKGTIITFPTQNIFTSRELFNYYFNQISRKDWKNEILFLKDNIRQCKDIPYLMRTKYFTEYKKFITKPSSLNYLCIYSDIIRPRIIGDCVSRIMYMHPIQNENELLNRNVININNIEYYPLERTQISEINVLIADETGEQINFEDSTFSTMILLHFRKSI